MMRDVIAITVASLALMLGACVRQHNRGMEQRLPKSAANVLATPPQASAVEPHAGRVQRVKALYLTLSEQLSSSPKAEDQDLALLAKAISEAKDEDVQSFMDSDYANQTAEKLDKNNKDDLPALLKDEKTRIAAISLVSLGAVAFGAGLGGGLRYGFNYENGNLFGKYQNVSAVAFGAAAIGVGSALLSNTENKRLEQGAKYLTLGAGVSSLILALPAAAAWHREKGYLDAVTRHLLTPDNVNVELSRINRHLKVAIGLGVLGAALITASQLGFDLAKTPSTPYETLQVINHLLSTKPAP